MTNDDVTPIQYLGYIPDMIRVTQEVQALAHIPETLETEQDKEQARKQIKARKKMVAGLHVEIRELENLLNKEK